HSAQRRGEALEIVAEQADEALAGGEKEVFVAAAGGAGLAGDGGKELVGGDAEAGGGDDLEEVEAGGEADDLFGRAEVDEAVDAGRAGGEVLVEAAVLAE